MNPFFNLENFNVWEWIAKSYWAKGDVSKAVRKCEKAAGTTTDEVWLRKLKTAKLLYIPPSFSKKLLL